MKQSFLPAKLEVVQKPGTQPLSYCYHCRHLMKEGEIVEHVTVTIEGAVRNKQRVHLAHERCVRRQAEK